MAGICAKKEERYLSICLPCTITTFLQHTTKTSYHYGWINTRPSTVDDFHATYKSNKDAILKYTMISLWNVKPIGNSQSWYTLCIGVNIKQLVHKMCCQSTTSTNSAYYKFKNGQVQSMSTTITDAKSMDHTHNRHKDGEHTHIVHKDGEHTNTKAGTTHT